MGSRTASASVRRSSAARLFLPVALAFLLAAGTAACVGIVGNVVGPDGGSVGGLGGNGGIGGAGGDVVPPMGGDVWWVSKTGSDANSGRAIDDAFATFRKALNTMAGGDTLYIDDGVYNESIGASAGENFTVWSDGEGKDGLSATQRTRILGFRPHAVVVDGGGTKYPLALYRAQHVEIGNIVFMHGKLGGSGAYSPVDIEESSDIYLHQVGGAYPDPACENCQGISVELSANVLIEECWVWGYGSRYGILLHGGMQNTVRRSVARYDGAANGDVKAAVTLYSEDQSIAENNVSIDYDLGPDSTGDVHAAFFTTSSVRLTPPSFPPGLPTGLKTVSWYGNVALNTVSTTESVMFIDSLTSIGGTVTVRDNVIANGPAPFASKGNSHGIWVSNDQGTAHTQITLDHNTIYNISGDGIRVDAPPEWRAVAFHDNLIANLKPASSQCFDDVSDDGSRITASNNQVFGCAPLAVPHDASLSTADPGLKYLLRIEPGTPGAGSGTGGSDRGANVTRRYVNGTLTDDDLWPFPNEDAIKADLCAGPDGTKLNGTAINTRGHNATGWCASGKTLTKYVWEQLGAASLY